MTNISMFGGAAPKDSNPKVYRQPNLQDKISALADKDGMKEDDPLKIILIEISKEIDKFKPLIASYGPDTGRLAAEAAATVMRQEAGRLSNRIRGKALAMTVLGAALLAGGGVWIGWTVRGDIPAMVEGAALPREMAERFPYQNWPEQWAARQSLPTSKDGFRWVMIPFAEGTPKPPQR